MAGREPRKALKASSSYHRRASSGLHHQTTLDGIRWGSMDLWWGGDVIARPDQSPAIGFPDSGKYAARRTSFAGQSVCAGSIRPGWLVNGDCGAGFAHHDALLSSRPANDDFDRAAPDGRQQNLVIR